MKRVYFGFFLAAALLAACGDDPLEPGSVERWVGELSVSEIVDGFPTAQPDTDAVAFTVEERLYSLVHQTNNSGLCNSDGEVLNFGSAAMTLVPIFTAGASSCDSLHVPAGTFRTAFRGDSLIVGPDTVELSYRLYQITYTDTMIFYFRLQRR